MGWVFFVLALIVLAGVTLWGLNQRKKYIELNQDYLALEEKMSSPIVPGQMVQIGQRAAYVLGEGFSEQNDPLVFVVYLSDMNNLGVKDLSDPKIIEIEVAIGKAEYQGIVMPLDVRE